MSVWLFPVNIDLTWCLIVVPEVQFGSRNHRRRLCTRWVIVIRRAGGAGCFSPKRLSLYQTQLLQVLGHCRKSKLHWNTLHVEIRGAWPDNLTCRSAWWRFGVMIPQGLRCFIFISHHTHTASYCLLQHLHMFSQEPQYARLFCAESLQQIPLWR